MRTAYSVLRMHTAEGHKKPCGIHGNQVNGKPGITVSYHALARIRGNGYRLTATQIYPDRNYAFTRPHEDPAKILEVLKDLEGQQKRIGGGITAKITADLQEHEGPLRSCVLLFQNYGHNKVEARYGFGIDDRGGITVRAKRGIVAGHQLVYIFVNSEGTAAEAVAVPDHAKIQTVIDDLSEQRRLALHLREYGCLPEDSQPNAACRTMLNQATSNGWPLSDNQVA